MAEMLANALIYVDSKQRLPTDLTAQWTGNLARVVFDAAQSDFGRRNGTIVGPMVYTGHVPRINNEEHPPRPECVKMAARDENNKTNGKRGGRGRQREARGRSPLTGIIAVWRQRRAAIQWREGDIVDW